MSLILRVLTIYVNILCMNGFILSPDPVVNTDCGPVLGLSSSAAGPYSFRGIPYAAPPVGQLRWRPPEAVSTQNKNCWNGTFHASHFGNICYQRRRNDTSQYHGSEDCLYLNVWTPTLNQSAKLPVAVWIHGGYLETGNGNEEGFSPTEKLSEETGTVYVSMNYRLQAFGFMALKWLATDSPRNTSGNYGFMDMIEVLRWVTRNIEAFGGDKSQVTIFGQSSGGTSIYALLASPLCKGLFHRAWASSPSPILNKTAADAFEDNEVFVNNTGCQDISCLYALSSEEVTQHVPWDVYPYWAMSDQLDLPEKGHFDGALPVIDGTLYIRESNGLDLDQDRRSVCMTRKFHNDKPHTNQQHREEETRISGFHMTARSPIKEINPRILFAYKEFSIPGYVLTEAPFDAWINGRGNDVPVMIGTTAQETDLGPAERDVASWNQSTYQDKVYRKLSTFSDAIAKMALRLYPVGNRSAEYQYTSMTTDLRMACGNDLASLVLAKSFSSPVYRYVATYTPSIPVSYHLYDTFVARYSAHMIDLYGFYGTMASLIRVPANADKAWEANMRRELLHFIKTGNPYTYSWRPFPEKTATLDTASYATDGYHTAECMFWLANGFFSYSWIN